MTAGAGDGGSGIGGGSTTQIRCSPAAQNSARAQLNVCSGHFIGAVAPAGPAKLKELSDTLDEELKHRPSFEWIHRDETADDFCFFAVLDEHRRQQTARIYIADPRAEGSRGAVVVLRVSEAGRRA